MTVYTFRHLSLEEAEAKLVGGAIRHQWALERCIERFPDDGRYCIRNPQTCRELRAIMGVLFLWLDNGKYDPEANEDRLALLLAAASQNGAVAYWADFIEATWDGLVCLQDYFDALLDSVLDAWRLQDEAIAATRALAYESPLAPDEDLQDAVFLRLREAILRAKNDRISTKTKPTDAPASGPEPRAQRRTIDAFRR